MGFLLTICLLPCLHNLPFLALSVSFLFKQSSQSELPHLLDIPVHSHVCASVPAYLFLCPSRDTGKNIRLGVRDAGLESRLNTNEPALNNTYNLLSTCAVCFTCINSFDIHRYSFPFPQISTISQLRHRGSIAIRTHSQDLNSVCF